MNVLVTGGAGYIGSHTVHALSAAGHSVFVYDNLSTGFRESLPPSVGFIEGDVRNSEDLTVALQKNSIQAVIHFAAKLLVAESLIKPLEYYETNVGGVMALAAACRRAQVQKVIFSSTAAVYGEGRNAVHGEGRNAVHGEGRNAVHGESRKVVDESSLTEPINPYGASKLMAERILRDCESAFGLKAICLRYFNVAGAAANGLNGQRSNSATHLIEVCAQAALGRRPFVEIFGTDFNTPDGSGVRDYIHVQDLADLHVLALQSLSAGGSSQVLNCGYGAGFSVLQVIEAMKRASGVNFEARSVARRAGDPSSLVADASAAQRILGWVPKHNNLELICKSTYDWARKRPIS